MKITLNLLRALFLQEGRSKQSLFWSFAFPLFVFVLLGLMFGKTFDEEPPVYRIGIDSRFAAQQDTPLYALSQMLDQIDAIELSFLERREGEKRLSENKIHSFITRENEGSPYTVFITERTRHYSSILSTFVDKFNLEHIKSTAHVNIPLPYTVKILEYRGIRFSYINFLLAGMIGISLMQNSLFWIPSLIINYRKLGFLKRFLFSPLKKTHFTASILLHRISIGCVQSLLLILSALIVFNVKLNISPVAFITSFLLGSATFYIMGFFLAGIVQSEQTSLAIAQILNMILMFTAGIYFPVEIMPKLFQGIAHINPIYYFAQTIFFSLLLGQGFGSIYKNIMVMTAFFTLFFLLTIATFRYEAPR